MQTVVLSLGGSLVNPGRPDSQYVASLVRLLRGMKYRFGIVVGGGKLARKWADDARKKGAQVIGGEVLDRAGLLMSPALVLNARNDPFVPAAALPQQAEVGRHVTLWHPAHDREDPRGFRPPAHCPAGPRQPGALPRGPARQPRASRACGCGAG